MSQYNDAEQDRKEITTVETNARSLCERITRLHEEQMEETVRVLLNAAIAQRKIMIKEALDTFSRFNTGIRYKHISRLEAVTDLGAFEKNTFDSVKREYESAVEAVINGGARKILLRDQRKAYVKKTIAETPGIAEHDTERVIIYTADPASPCLARTDVNIIRLRASLGTSSKIVPSEKQILEALQAQYTPTSSNLPSGLQINRMVTDALLDEEASQAARVYLARNPFPEVTCEDMTTYLIKFLMSQYDETTTYSSDRLPDRIVAGSISAALEEATKPDLRVFWPGQHPEKS